MIGTHFSAIQVFKIENIFYRILKSYNNITKSIESQMPEQQWGKLAAYKIWWGNLVDITECVKENCYW